MILNSVKLNNFRQYKGEHEVEFAKGEKNITIVVGRNGAGKTGLLRAVMFCLYGTRLLEQDSKEDEGNLHLINIEAIEERPNDDVVASVEMNIEHNNKTYIVDRALKVSGADPNKVEKPWHQFNIKILKGGRTLESYSIQNKDQEFMDGIINEILDEKIKELFFLDGEKIEELATSKAKANNDVQKGIKRLMKIDKLDNLEKVLGKVYRGNRDELAGKRQGTDLPKLKSDEMKFKVDIAKAKKELASKEKELEVEQANEEKYEKILSENEQLAKIIDLKKAKENENDFNKQELQKMITKLSEDFMANTSCLILKDFYSDISDSMDVELMNKNDIIPIQVINETLKKKKCLCCNRSVDEAAIEFVELLKKNYQDDEITGKMRNFSSALKRNTGGLDFYSKTLESHIKKIEDLKAKIIETDSDIERYTMQITAYGDRSEELANTEKALRDTIMRKGSLSGAINSLERKIEVNEKNLAANELKIKNEISKEKNLNKDVEICNFLENFYDHMKTLKKDYAEEIRREISKKTTIKFKELIDDADTLIVDRVDIDETYRIRMFSKENKEVKADISQGQSNIAAIAFIIALAEITADEEYIYPLFMDTPFGRMSLENRKNLIKMLPNLTAQWIPLFTDTEYSDNEKKIFEKYNRVGKAYMIEKVSAKSSVIKEVRI